MVVKGGLDREEWWRFYIRHYACESLCVFLYLALLNIQ
jgi:hypothetical protein